MSTPCLQRLDLRPRAHAAEDQDRALLQVAAVLLERLADLRGQLARRHEHQQPRRARAARIGVLLVEALQQRQRERGGLARAGLRGGEQVAAAVDRGNRVQLDGRGRRVAEFLHRAQERRPEGREIQKT